MFQVSGASDYQVDYDVIKASAPGKQKVSPLDLENSTPKIKWVDHLRRIQANQDQQAFAELFSYFAPRVKAFLIKSGANPGLAEECTQEVMATLWHKADLFDPSRAGVSTWIFTIARNKKIDALRKQRRPEPEDLAWGPEAEPEAADVLELQQETKNLAKAITRLPEQQRDSIKRAYYGDLSHSEIAAETGLPLGTIKSRLRLALVKLRQTMK
jgi:RNA polymerase sigma-70 factor (ECF subfamily)